MTKTFAHLWLGTEQEINVAFQELRFLFLKIERTKEKISDLGPVGKWL